MTTLPTTSATLSSPAGILLIGEVLADVFIERSLLGGAPFNVARHLQAFAAPFTLRPTLISRTGDDQLRTQLFASMRDYGMDTDYIQLDPMHPTGKVQVHMTADGHHFEIVDEQAYDYIDAQLAQTSLDTAPQLIYFGTLAQRHAVSRSAIDTLLVGAKAKQPQALKFLDINLRQPWYTRETIIHSLRHADIVKMNEDELLVLAGLLALPGGRLHAHGRALVQEYALRALVVTAGAKGAWQLGYDGSILHADIVGDGCLSDGHAILEDSAHEQVALVHTPLVDTVGAGDAFAAVYLLGLLRAWPASLLLSRAHRFARAMCTQRGGVPESADFYRPFLQQWQPDQR